MNRNKPFSWSVLILAGVSIIGMGTLSHEMRLHQQGQRDLQNEEDTLGRESRVARLETELRHLAEDTEEDRVWRSDVERLYGVLRERDPSLPPFAEIVPRR